MPVGSVYSTYSIDHKYKVGDVVKYRSTNGMKTATVIELTKYGYKVEVQYDNSTFIASAIPEYLSAMPDEDEFDEHFLSGLRGLIEFYSIHAWTPDITYNPNTTNGYDLGLAVKMIYGATKISEQLRFERKLSAAVIKNKMAHYEELLKQKYQSLIKWNRAITSFEELMSILTVLESLIDGGDMSYSSIG